MANSTYFATVNRILERHGQIPIPDQATFDSGTLNKTQIQTKLWTDEVHRLICLEFPAEFLKRTGTISTSGSGAAGVPTLADNTTGWALACLNEDVVPRSVFITTLNTGGELWPKRYEDFVREQPDNNRVVSRPTHYVPLPQTQVGATVDSWCFDNPPDLIYTIQYSYYLRTPALAQSTDQILLPLKFEPLLWQAVGHYVEISQGQGQSPAISEYLIPTFTKVHQLILGLESLPQHVQMGIVIRGVKRRNLRTAWSPHL